MNISVSDLKRAARGKLLGNYSIVIGAAIVINIMVRVLSSVVSAPLGGLSLIRMFTQGISIPALILYFVTRLIIIFISEILNYGFVYINYMIAKDKKVAVEDIFYVFSHSPFTVIKLSLIEMGFYTVICIPFVIAWILIFTYLISLENYIGIIIAYISCILVVFAMIILAELFLFCCKFIYFENNDMPALQIIKNSMQLMKGNKLKLLYLNISFIPIFMLSLLTIGLANFWLSPYKMVTESNFYFALLGKKPKEKPDWRPYISNADFSNINNSKYNPYNRF